MKFKYLIICLILFVACKSSTNITVIPVGVQKMDSSVMDHKILVRKFDFFLMKGYRNDAASNSFIDNYVRNNSPERSRYFEYHMFFLKESAITTLQSLRESLKPKAQALANEDDFVSYYNWRNYGREFEKEKSDSGKTLPPKDIKIKMVPVPEDTVKK